MIIKGIYCLIRSKSQPHLFSENNRIRIYSLGRPYAANPSFMESSSLFSASACSERLDI